MTTPSSPSTELQFDRAELPDAPSAPICETCRQQLMGEYYKVESKVLCGACRTRAEVEWNSGSAGARFGRALLFGLGGAIGGAALYYGVTKLTGYELGIISAVVGMIVGRAVNKGTNGRGGRGYQVLAVFLTYFAIAGAYAPFMVEELMKDPAASAPAESAQTGTTPAVTSEVQAAPPDVPVAESAQGPDAAAPTVSDGAPITRTDADAAVASSVGLAMVVAFFLILALPIFVATSSLISAFIILFGLWEAWRVNARRTLQIEGPFTLGASADAVATVPQGTEASGS